ncbi:MAG: alginate O-acetyltransferase complex protein AlgI [Psychroserpens sp.]|jgi:alginate O-acetyltransferase complex protein AlgI
MLFNSIFFVLFLFVVVCLYYLPLLKNLQVFTLIIASFFFYAFHNFPLLALLLVSVLINTCTSYLVIYRINGNQKLYATIGVICNLLILVFFKYSPLISPTFFADNKDIDQFLLSIPLPIGISFYTFQGISLLVDVYREELSFERQTKRISFLKHLSHTSLYIAFFPQLVAGPIVKAHEFLPQIKQKFFFEIDWEYCFKYLLVGYFLKNVVADNLKEFTYWIEYPYFLSYKSMDLFFLLFGYSCQIFADFAGYSLIALGLAGLFGYKLHINFNFPYISSSFKDFWKRWHISLSSFLMEYLYFPLGGSKKGKIRTYINLFIVMALGGLWHGASWSYLVWGMVHGTLLSVERFLFSISNKNLDQFNNFFYSIFVFFIVTMAWLFFRLDFHHAVLYYKHMFSAFSFSFSTHLVLHILLYSLPVFLYHIYGVWATKMNYRYFQRYEFVIFGILLFLIFANSGTSGSFIYFQF